MMDEDETRVLGLRGLFVEARRRGDAGAARNIATEAVRLAPAATWASDAVLEARCAERDWRGALEAVERRASLGLLDKRDRQAPPRPCCYDRRCARPGRARSRWGAREAPRMP